MCNYLVSQIIAEIFWKKVFNQSQKSGGWSLPIHTYVLKYRYEKLIIRELIRGNEEGYKKGRPSIDPKAVPYEEIENVPLLAYSVVIRSVPGISDPLGSGLMTRTFIILCEMRPEGCLR